MAIPDRTSAIIGRPLIRFDRVASTMDVAARLAALGSPEGTIVEADLQTAGRGRGGRRWYAPAGSALMVSIILRPGVSAARLVSMSLLAGLAVANVAEAITSQPATIKWPNDVLIDGRKVAGILLHSRTMGDAPNACLILGIGINVRVTSATRAFNATSLDEAAGDRVYVGDVRHRLVVELRAVYRAFTGGDLAPAWAELTDRLAYRDREVTIVDGERALRGMVTGLGENGELLLRRPDGVIQSIISGEMVRGPRPVAS